VSRVPAVDLEGFRSAMRDSGIEEIVMPMLTLFRQEAPKGIASLTTALEERDLNAASRAAHSLKSSSANIRAMELADLLQQLELAAQAGDAAVTASLFDRVKIAYDEAIECLVAAGVES
jgi:HPt (histidine-containing phosphotransfer) domain-containing protein